MSVPHTGLYSWVHTVSAARDNIVWCRFSILPAIFNLTWLVHKAVLTANFRASDTGHSTQGLSLSHYVSCSMLKPPRAAQHGGRIGGLGPYPYPMKGLFPPSSKPVPPNKQKFESPQWTIWFPPPRAKIFCRLCVQFLNYCKEFAEKSPY